jgi:hypothetical protein
MILFFSILLACKDAKESSYSISSNDDVNTFDDSDNLNDDAADTADTYEELSVAPEIRNIVAFFRSLGTEPPKIEVHARVDDVNDDLMNGSVEVNYSTGFDSYELSLVIDGIDAFTEGGDVYFFIEEGVNSNNLYSLSVVISDEAGNSSLPYTTEVVP